MILYQPMRSLVASTALTVFLAVLHVAASANAQWAESSTGTSSPQTRQQALESIPFHQLTPENQQRVTSITRNTSIYRRLPVTTVNSDPDLYCFLTRYPEVIIGIWQMMGVTQMTADRIDSFKLATNDGAGTDARVEMIYASPHLHIYYGEGVYEGPMLLRKVNGQCLIVLHTGYHLGEDGSPLATSQLDVFLKLDNVAANLVAKTVQPIVGSTADQNFVETLRFVQNLHQTTVRNGTGVQAMAQRIPNVRPEVRQRFIEIAQVVAQRSGQAPVSQPPHNQIHGGQLHSSHGHIPASGAGASAQSNGHIHPYGLGGSPAAHVVPVGQSSHFHAGN